MTQENKGGKFLSSDIRYKCNGHEFGQTLGDGEGQRGLADCSRGGHKSWTWLGNWTTTIDANTKVIYSGKCLKYE